MARTRIFTTPRISSFGRKEVAPPIIGALGMMPAKLFKKRYST